MIYYVFENRVLDRSRVHRAECGHCSCCAADRSSDAERVSQWHGPFDRDEAFAHALQLNRQDFRACAVCNP
jgi:hypothetical protein